MVPAGDSATKAVKASRVQLQMLQRFAEVLLLVWTWFKTWLDMGRNGYTIYQQWPRPDIRYSAPQVMLVLGLVATNALDLDALYLAYKHGAEVVRGEANAEWEKLRLRNSLWRSLPLAMMSFALTCRVLFEVPLCQASASASAMAVGFWPELANESCWARDMRRDGVAFLDIEWAANYKEHGDLVSQVSEDLRRGGKSFGRDLLNLEHSMWSASHCHDSQWQQAGLPLKQARLEDQVGAAGDKEDARAESQGLSNLLALNVVTFERARMEALRREYTLKPAVSGLISRLSESNLLAGAGVVTVNMMGWETLLDLAIGFLEDNLRQDEIQTVHSGRPWTLKITDKWQATVHGGWKVRLSQASVLFLAAVLPVRKRILESFSPPPPTPKNALVTLYTSLDLTCLVTAWVLCAIAPAAYHLGALFENTIDNLWPLIEELVDDVKPNSEMKDMTVAMFKNLLKLGPDLAKTVWKLVPVLAWDWQFFLKLVLGAVCFLAVSSALAHWLSPDTGIATCASVGVCGPLRLFTDESESRGTIGINAFIAVVLRSVLFGVIVAWSWSSVNDFSVQLFFAMTFKLYLSKDALIWSWIALLVVHLLCGFAAVSALGSADDSDSSDESDEETGLQPPKATATTYSTFAVTSQSDEKP